MNYELIALAVTILAAMGAGFTWLSHQMKDVRDELKADIKDARDELKTDIKRVEDKLDNKERELRQEFRSDIEKITAEVIEQKLELERNSIRSKERAKETRTLQERFDHLVAALRREMPRLEI